MVGQYASWQMAQLGGEIKETISFILSFKWISFHQLGNHDNPRISSRFGEDLVDALNMFTTLLPGTAVTYYGEEIGIRIEWKMIQF